MNWPRPYIEELLAQLTPTNKITLTCERRDWAKSLAKALQYHRGRMRLPRIIIHRSGSTLTVCSASPDLPQPKVHPFI